MMESNKMNKENKMDHAHFVARKFESEIKKILEEKYDLNPEDLVLLLDDEDGVYLDDKDPSILCVMVVGQKNGYLYLVTAKIEENNSGLTNFKSDIVS